MIREHEIAALLETATADIDVPAAPADALARVGRRRIRRRRFAAVAGAVSAVAIVATAVPLTLAGGPPGPGTPGGCVSHVPVRTLPAWARSGFSGPRPRVSYVSSDHGRMIAILFGQPLTSPPSKDHNNKILWVARAGPGNEPPGPSDPDLRITAELGDGTAVVRTVRGGSGPSIIDLPKPGCWHLTLRWSGHTDTLDLRYAPG